MTLDLTKIAPQVGEMVTRIKSGNRERWEHLKCALDKLAASGIVTEQLKRKIAHSRTPWPVAGLTDDISGRFSPPPAPADYTVLAADGSHIDVDRNQSAHCYLINIGTVSICYGSACTAQLDSFPRLYSDEADLVISSRENKLQKENVQGTLLDARRSVEECTMLARMTAGLPENTTSIVLLDGSLILFGLENHPRFVADELLLNGFLKQLDSILEQNNRSKVALCSYVSLPKSSHVANALKVAFCPHEKADCEQFCSDASGPCEAISGVQDSDLFSQFLSPGQRSALFINPSVIVDKYYGRHRVFFFYLRLEDEIARIEVPEWVAQNGLLELTHALVLDQCRRGHGYPVALSEAHEQAVVTGTDRELFWGLVEESLLAENLPVNVSVKSRSKRTRWI